MKPFKIGVIVGHEKKAPGARLSKPWLTHEYYYNSEIAQLMFTEGEKLANVDVEIFYRDGVGISGAYMKARAATFLCFMGDFEAAKQSLQDAEALDPLLPIWAGELMGAVLYASGLFDKALATLEGLQYLTMRSRLYAVVSLVALGRVEEAQRRVKEALINMPGLWVGPALFHERYQDPAQRQLLAQRLQQAGLPMAPA